METRKRRGEENPESQEMPPRKRKKEENQRKMYEFLTNPNVEAPLGDKLEVPYKIDEEYRRRMAENAEVVRMM